MTDSKAGAPRPLDGVRVIDAATFIAGPYCASVLAEFGAEVFKVEQPGMGDSMRGFGTPTSRVSSNSGRGDTLVWLSEARNKKSITLDLRHKKGAELFRQLTKTSDVVCENFRPGTFEKWGLGYDALAAVNAGIILLRVTGYGQDGPYKDRPGFARIAHAVGGLTHLSGMPGGVPVVPGSTSLADYMSGLYGAVGVMMALRARDQSGVGQFIDLGLYESIFRALDEIAPAYAMTGFVRERLGPATVNVCPHSHYQTGDGKWVAIACTNDKMFARLAKVMGREELATADYFATIDTRYPAREEVDGIVSAWTGSLDRDEVLAACIAGEVPCGPINSIADIFNDPQFRARGNLVPMDTPGVGEVVVPGVIPRLSKTPGRIDTLGPPLGNANDEVYRGILGLGDADMDSLRAEGVI